MTTWLRSNAKRTPPRADEHLARELRKASGFRNVLVHGYIDIDEEVVTSRLNALDDLREFSSQIAAYLLDP